MTRPDVARLFFGVSLAGGPRGLLGLGSGPVDHATIEAAARMRLRDIDAHELASTAEAQEARLLIEAAAAALRASERDGSARTPIPPARVRPKPPAPVPSKMPVQPTPRVTEAHLTAFDRLVLSVLLAGGGWNSRTRGIITGLALQVGLDGENLRRVVLGLARLARARGAQGIVDSASETVVLPLRQRAPGRVEATLGRVSEQLAREVRGDSIGSRARLILVAVAITCVVGVVLFGVLFTPTKSERSLVERRQVAEEKVARAMAIEREGRLVESEAVHIKTPATRPGVVVPAKYARPPTFKGNPRPEEALIRLDRSGAYPVELSDLAARLELNPGRLPEARFSLWLAGIANAAGTWPLTDPAQRELMQEGIGAVLEYAIEDAVAQRLLGALAVDPASPITDPLDVWRRAFNGGMLAVASGGTAMPGAVRASATALLEEAFGSSDVGLDVRRGPFAAGAGQTLDAMVKPLVGMTGIDPAALEAWELWLAAQHTVRGGGAFESAIAKAIGAWLSSGRNLAVDGEPIDVLGRLIAEIDWGPSGPDPLALREQYAQWLAEARNPSVSVWVLASLLDGSRRVAWFRPEFVPAPEAGIADRMRVSRLALRAWPEPVGPVARGNHVLVAAGMLEAFDDALSSMRAAVAEAQTPIERMRLLLGSARLAEVGALLVREQLEEASATLRLIKSQSISGSTEEEKRRSLIGRRGQRPDGEWAEAFDQASGNQRNQIEVLRALRERLLLASDLGPIDAKAFVEAVWRGGSAAIRSTAQSIVLGEFINGPLVSLELLDRSDRSPLSDDTLEFVEAYTGEAMPSNNADDARVRMRRALARKALALHDDEREPIDRLASAVGASLEHRIRTIDPKVRVPSTAGIAEIAAMSTNVVRAKASLRLFADPFPATLDELDASRTGRGWLAASGPQRLAAALAAESDYLAYIVAADIPSARAQVVDSLERGAINRDRASSAVLQSIQTFLEIATLERLRLKPRMHNPLGGVS